MNMKTIIPANDVLTSELESVFGGAEPIEEIVCKGDGVVQQPTTPTSVTVF